MNRKIYLVRHGRIDIGKEKCYIGFTDLTLSKEGIVQAQKLKSFFSNVDIEKAYVSPLIRCIQTLDIILENRNVERILMKELMEINLGEWEGKSFSYIKRFFPEQFKDRGENIDTFVTPGGESFEQLKKRVIPAFEAIKENSTGNVLIVAHAGVNRVIKIMDV
jgi:alpha-ribazole phosphatase